MNTQMMIWVMVLACVAVLMIVKTFSRKETAPSDGHIFDEETGQRVNNWKYTTEDDGE